MSFQPCAVVPCYNHGAAVGGVVARLREHGLPVIVVDDGSDTETAQVLDALAGIHLFRLERNRGKGAAVSRGLREAHRLGFSHALQVDADGQHDLDDVPRFLERGRAVPHAVVCADPFYDETIPRSRLHGKKITHFWVAIETLGAARGDSMCGYRLYPLARAIPIVKRIRSRGMGFDIDVLVHLIWRGAAVETVRTRVVYPAGGVSHFRPLRDNVRISLTHARLFIGMLARLPRWLVRGCTWRHWWQRGHWSRLDERGAMWGLRFVSGTAKLLGRQAGRLALLPAVAWFFLTGREARRASRIYLARLGAQSTPPTIWNVWRHMLAFADASLDKLAAWRGEITHGTVDFHGAEEFARLAREKRGALFIGSHLGNLEMIRALAVTREIATVTAVVYTDHARRFAATLAGANRRFAENLFEVRDFGPQTAILLKQRIERGEILVIVGDRTPAADNGRRAHASFLGHDAPFPQGPMVLGYLLGCPVYLFFCLRDEKRDGSHYRLYLEPFAEKIELPHRERQSAIDAYVARYAKRLEWYCREAPLQWFNFFDFWHEPLGRS